MPKVEVVCDVHQNVLHVICNLCVPVANKCGYGKPTSKQKIHAPLESHELHGWAISCFISLANKIEVERENWKKEMHVHKFSRQLMVLGYAENGYSIKKTLKKLKGQEILQ